jgi:hypothetical protein
VANGRRADTNTPNRQKRSSDGNSDDRGLTRGVEEFGLGWKDLKKQKDETDHVRAHLEEVVEHFLERIVAEHLNSVNES